VPHRGDADSAVGIEEDRQLLGEGLLVELVTSDRARDVDRELQRGGKVHGAFSLGGEVPMVIRVPDVGAPGKSVGSDTCSTRRQVPRCAKAPRIRGRGVRWTV
jgi:hypothetical protein